jgi:RNA polymerase sigma-70 factor (ECF subfamily)
MESPGAVGGTDARLRMQELAAADDDSSSSSGESNSLVQRAAELVRAEFEPRSWQAFLLIAIEHKTAAETAAQLGLTVGAARQAKYAILKRLREELAGELPDRPGID